jgi:hypothetical protein
MTFNHNLAILEAMKLSTADYALYEQLNIVLSYR